MWGGGGGGCWPNRWTPPPPPPPRRTRYSESVSMPWFHYALPTSQWRSFRFNDACVYVMYYGAYLCNRNEAFGADERSRLIMISEGPTLLVSYYPFISQRLSLPSGASKWNWNVPGHLQQTSDHHDSVVFIWIYLAKIRQEYNIFLAGSNADVELGLFSYNIVLLYSWLDTGLQHIIIRYTKMVIITMTS